MTDPMEAAGVNDRAQLAVAEAELRDRINERWMRRGVTMWDPERTYVDAEVELGHRRRRCCPGSILQGRTMRRRRAPRSGPTCTLERLPGRGAGRDPQQRAASGPWSGPGPGSGPFASLGPGSVVADGEVVGPFTVLHRRPDLDAAARRHRRPRPGAVASPRGADPPTPPRAGVGALPPGARPADRRAPGRRARRGQPAGVRQRRGPLPLRHLDPGLRRLHRPDPLRPGQRLADGAAHHDRRRQAGVGQADHRRVPLLRLLPPGPQVHRARADHGQAGGRHAVRRPGPTGW